MSEIDWNLLEPGGNPTWSLALPEGIGAGFSEDGPNGLHVAFKDLSLFIPEDRVAAFREWALAAVADFAPLDPTEKGARGE